MFCVSTLLFSFLFLYIQGNGAIKNINCSSHVIKSTLDAQYKDIVAYDIDNYMFIAINNMTLEEFNSTLNFYVNLQKQCNQCERNLNNFSLIIFTGYNNSTPYNWTSTNVTENFLNIMRKNESLLEFYNNSVIKLPNFTTFVDEFFNSTLYPLINSSISTKPGGRTRKQNLIFLSDFCFTNFTTLSALNNINNNISRILNLNYVFPNLSTKNSCKWLSDNDLDNFRRQIFTPNDEDDTDIQSYCLMNNLIGYHFDAFINPVNVFIQLKLVTLQLINVMLPDILLSNSSLCQLASYDQSYYFNMQILDGPPGHVIESEFIIPYMNNNDISNYILQLLIESADSYTSWPSSTQCNSSYFTNTLKYIFQEDFPDDRQQFNIFITDQYPFCIPSISSQILSMKKHFDMIIINDGTLGNLELVLKEAWTYIFQDWNSTFRANHVVMINSSNNNFVFDDVSICKAQMAPTIYATGPKSNFFTKYMNYIIGFGVFVLIIFSMIICLCVYVCVVKYKNSKMEKRLEKAEFVQSFNRKASVVMEERLYASSRDLFQIGDKKLMINFESIIGRGASAVVYRGFLQGASPLNTHFKSIETQRFQNCDVAIKVPTNMDRDEFEQIIREIDSLKQIGYHQYIMSLLGWYMYNDVPCLVFDVAQRDLLSFVRSLRDKDEPLPMKLLLSILWQVASGMAYVSSLQLVHRDIAARNILLTVDFRAKISDFGLCCTCDETFTYRASLSKKMPIKWLAIESLVDRIFSEKSDVWAFGVLCYEVFSKGVTPYTALTNQEMMEFLQSGQRLPKPAETLDEIYEIMTSCWLKDSEERPNFSQLVGLLRVILERQTESYGYLGYDPTLEEEEDNGDESIAL